MDEQVVGTEPDVATGRAALALGEQVQDGSDPKRREDVSRNLETERSPDLPGLCVGRSAKVDLAAHDHGDELVARGEPLLLDADRVARILVAGNAARALEIAEGGAASRIEEGIDGGVGVRRRVMDLRD